MNRRIRPRSAAVHGHLRYLKPGALAQLRYRKIHARTHRRSSDIQISPSRITPDSASPSRSGSVQQQEAPGTTAVADGESPNFPVRFYGPRCPQRKKLMAARLTFHSEQAGGSEPVIDAFTNDFLVAH
ncbi:hypothetical protein SSX86_024053 [Deinandra increscens subsp. villosa]|uniref:Uncharacterized protein n=1 Tax=Deinandra increscens subsp. villosa TaxID=3103831 RepID=A0AAP0CIK9_9ASTR